MPETKSRPATRPQGKSASHHETAIAVRVVLVGVLAITFVGALRWAMNVTQANARQVSRNVQRLKNHLGKEKLDKEKLGKEKPRATQLRSAPGPVIEPMEDTPRRTPR